MNCELEYQAWALLDQLDSHPDLEERKRLIVDRTLQRIERANCGHLVVSRRVFDLTALLRVAGPLVEGGESPANGAKIA